MAGLRSGEGRMMINSVVWAQFINVTDAENSHVATAGAPMQYGKKNQTAVGLLTPLTMPSVLYAR